MTYQLGVDLGTTKIAAAIWDGEQVRPVQLGNRSTAVPSVVFLRDDGTAMFGEAAQRRADSEPNRAAREFKRRVGDPVPLWLAGTSFSAQRLMAMMLAWVIDRVAQLEGEPPITVVVTHPANWGPYKRESLLGAIRDAGVESVRLLPEPIAAAIHFDSVRRVSPGETVAIYDLGGGTFDAAVLRRGAIEFEILGVPGGIDSVGGMEFDEAVLGQVWAALGGGPAATDPTRMAVLRREIVEAKEYLSEDVSADISVDLAALVLVGGSSRVPLVQELLRSRLGCPVVLDNQPQKLEPIDPQTELLVPFDALIFSQRPIQDPAVAPPSSAAPESVAPEPAALESAPEPAEEMAALPAEPGTGPDESLSGWFRNLSPLGLVLLLIGVAIAVFALVSGINAALSISGQGGAAPGVASVPVAATASGAALPLVPAWPWRLPTIHQTAVSSRIGQRRWEGEDLIFAPTIVGAKTAISPGGLPFRAVPPARTGGWRGFASAGCAGTLEDHLTWGGSHARA